QPGRAGRRAALRRHLPAAGGDSRLRPRRGAALVRRGQGPRPAGRHRDAGGRPPRQRRPPWRTAAAGDRAAAAAAGGAMTTDELKAVVLEEIAAIAPDAVLAGLSPTADLR